MGEFLVFLAGLPSIALSAIFGALFGLVGGLLGVILKRWGFTNAWRYAAGIAVAVSVPLTSNLIKPAIQDATLNDGLPKKLDDVTIHEATKVIPGGVEYRFRLVGAIPPDFKVSAVKQKNLQGLCQIWKPDLDAGRATKIIYSYTWDGGADAYSVVPGDCK
ncbi:hypothetical protein ASF03_09250 [Rhizobium sp. Leaf68]|nr:hypothetical protein ASE62_09140 [Rhizobium sp. Leaf202]KQN85818.1 hypothetical protein ASF03_09250 [Rhizobium sp. Leaf68]